MSGPRDSDAPHSNPAARAAAGGRARTPDGTEVTEPYERTTDGDGSGWSRSVAWRRLRSQPERAPGPIGRDDRPPRAPAGFAVFQSRGVPAGYSYSTSTSKTIRKSAHVLVPSVGCTYLNFEHVVLDNLSELL